MFPPLFWLRPPGRTGPKDSFEVRQVETSEILQRRDLAKRLAIDQTKKEALRQILGILSTVPSPANKRIKRGYQ